MLGNKRTTETVNTSDKVYKVTLENLDSMVGGDFKRKKKTKRRKRAKKSKRNKSCRGWDCSFLERNNLPLGKV